MNNRKFKNWLKRSGVSFNPSDSSYITEVLNGQRNSLMNAFMWLDSPQGDDFWCVKFQGGRLSKRTRSFLAKLRDEAKRRGC